MMLRFVPILIVLALAGCAAPAPETPAATLPSPPTDTPAATADLPTATPTSTSTATPTLAPTLTPTPTATFTPTSTATPAGPFGIVSADMAFCRYGPGTAYLYSHGLAAGDHVLIDGKNATGAWLWVKPDNLPRHCWAAKSVMTVTGDLATVNLVTTELPFSTFYGPPSAVNAKRDGNQVTVSWNRVVMTEDDDRGYLLEVYVCQGGAYLFVAVQTYNRNYTFTDEPGCPAASSGLLYTVDKHGYSAPLVIPWP